MPKDRLAKVKNRNKKILQSCIIMIITILIIIGLGGYFLARSYINKMNLISTKDQEQVESSEQIPEEDTIDEVLSEDLVTEGTDSPEDAISKMEENIIKNMEDKSTPIATDKDVLNVLLIGSDTRKAGGSGRSDAMIIISINKKTKKIIATSILRDIYLQIPSGESNRINSAYAYGGADLLMETIEQNFKIQLDRFASIDFYSFMDIVDAVGGVMIEVTEPEIPIINEYVRNLNRLTGAEEEQDILTAGGTYLLNGKQALGYARNRYIGTDFERTARQRRVLEQIFLNIKDMGLLELNNLLNIILPQVTTNLTEGEIFSLLLSLPSFKGYTRVQWSIPVDGTYSFLRIRGMDVIGIDFEANIKELQARIYENR
jgi:LCP family protein required for cell wall assembly